MGIVTTYGDVIKKIVVSACEIVVKVTGVIRDWSNVGWAFHRRPFFSLSLLSTCINITSKISL